MAGDPVSVDVVLTDKLRRYFRSALTKSDLPNDLREQIRKYVSGRRSSESSKRRTVPYSVVKSVQNIVNAQQDGAKIYLHELLDDSDLHLPGIEEPKRDPEYEARLERLRAQQANRDYAEMTKNIDNTRMMKPEISVKAEMKAVNNQLLAVFNFVITVLGSFAFVYKAVEYSMEKPNLPVQICSGLIVGTMVFFADLYFLIKNTI